MPSQLSKGTAAFNNYPGTNSQVTADLLNNLVDNGTILPGAISEQSSVAAASSDEVLIRRPGTNTLHRATVNSVVSNVVIPVPTNIPIGGIIMWGATLVPANWLECNGDAFSSITYPDLAAVYGTNLPDLRGVFVRGLNRGKTVNGDPDVNRAILSYQADAYQQHSHTTAEGGFQTNIFGGSYYTSSNANPSNQRAAQTTSTAGTSTETRPKNVALMYIVRAL